jgi:glycosyltransferase involved in cell wall biosynthesis
MHIVYMGIISRPEDIGKIGEASVAGNKMQYNLLKYLSRYDDMDIDIVSFHPFKSFPHGKKLFVKTVKEKLFDNVDLWQVGYINLPVIKQLVIPITTYFRAKKLIKNKNDVLFLYDMYPNQGIPMSMLRKKVKDNTLCLLADLSVGQVAKTKGVKKLLRVLYENSTLSNMKKCKNYIALNENAMKKYVPESRYIIVDGGIEPSEFAEKEHFWAEDEKNVIYTGALVDYSGIMNLITAMDLIEDKSIVLDIYGDGPLKSEIERISAENKRICYHGRVDNKTAIKAQQSAWLLANPRPTQSEIAMVTFPSKIFEYLMSERPVMTTRLNGFSKDYDDILYWIDGETPKDIAECINKINKETNDTLLKRAKLAKEYLLKNKTWEINAKKIHEFMLETFGVTNGK